MTYVGLSDPEAVSALLLLSRSGERSPVVGRAIELAGEVFG